MGLVLITIWFFNPSISVAEGPLDFQGLLNFFNQPNQQTCSIRPQNSDEKTISRLAKNIRSIWGNLILLRSQEMLT